MNPNAWPIALSASLLACAGSEPYDQRLVGTITHGLMYMRGDGLEAIQCQGGNVPTMCGSVEIMGEQIFSDCSDEQYECIFNTADVFAIPRAGLTPGQDYRVFGAKLRVERCFGEKGGCEVAMIKSECADEQTCSCRSAVRGRTTTYYFSQELGITTFYSIGDATSLGVDSKMLADAVPLVTFVLTADKGFLRTPLALPKIAQTIGCRG